MSQHLQGHRQGIQPVSLPSLEGYAPEVLAVPVQLVQQCIVVFGRLQQRYLLDRVQTEAGEPPAPSEISAQEPAAAPGADKDLQRDAFRGALGSMAGAPQIQAYGFMLIHCLQKSQESQVLDRAKQEMEKYEADAELLPLIEDGYFQLGSLGGGNHFIELQENQDGYLCIMIHSGSRHLGKSVCDYFHKKANELNRRWYSEVKEEYRLAFLPVQTEEGQQYIRWMNLSMDYAFENRKRMLEKTCRIVKELIGKHAGLTVEFGEEINCHHNYAALENHYRANVWVHRKGATRVREGEMAVIPGAMGSYSYVVEGKGNPETFCSSSHGAGRNYSRSGAMKEFSIEKVMVERGVVLGKRKKNDVAEECRFAYKDIDQVMAQQSDLVTPVRKLKTVGVVKG